jgi:hypothetical protein
VVRAVDLLRAKTRSLNGSASSASTADALQRGAARDDACGADAALAVGGSSSIGTRS